MSNTETEPTNELSPRRRARAGLAFIYAMTAGGWGLPFMCRQRRSAQMIRNDPDRVKTEDDLRRIERASIKRERKAARKSSLKPKKRPSKSRKICY